MKVTMIIGEPAVGKSTLMKALIECGRPWEFANPAYIPYHHSRSLGLTIIGNYSDPTHEFPGTDRMSMAAQPHAVNWLLKAQNNNVKSVIFEGDRLGNDKMIKSLQYFVADLEVICLVTNVDRSRASQTSKFRASRRTKIENMTGVSGRMARTGREIKQFEHDTPEDTAKIVEYLIAERI